MLTELLFNVYSISDPLQKNLKHDKVNPLKFGNIFMQFYLIIVLIFFVFQGESIEPAKTVCLNMIVKNESKVITRCLESVKPLIDYWVIVDTGSSDDTQTIIKDFMKNIPGELHEKPWVDFAHNRNEALALAKGKADYILFIDADEVLSFTPDFKKPTFDKDFYFILTEFSGTHYHRIQLVNGHLPWSWTGVLHETIGTPEAHTNDVLKGVTNVVRTDGHRSQDEQKFQKDAKILENALKKEPTNTRYAFYLAQSYRDAQDYPNALINYEKRIAMGGWDQEIFWSMLQVALIKENLNRPKEDIISSYVNAFIYRPSRSEPLYRLASYYRRAGDYLNGYRIASIGLTTTPSTDILFVEHWVDDYGMLLERSICAYWIEKYAEAYDDCKVLLAKQLPQNVRDCVEKNLTWVNLKLAESKGPITTKS